MLIIIDELGKHGTLCIPIRLLFLKLLTTCETNINWTKVSILWDSHLIIAALLAETSTTVTAVLSFICRECATELRLAVLAVKCQVSWNPNRGLPRLIFSH